MSGALLGVVLAIAAASDDAPVTLLLQPAGEFIEQEDLIKDLDLPEGSELRVPWLWKNRDTPPRWYELTVPLRAGESATALLERIRAHPSGTHAEIDHEASGLAPDRRVPALERYQPPEQGVVPRAPWFPFQYYLRSLRLPEAWAVTTGSEDVLVAVLDDGCNGALPEYGGRVLPGIDLVEGKTGVPIGSGHGNAVTSIIAASDNDRTMAGICWNCRVLPVRMVEGGVSVWAQAIEHAVAEGADVINISGKLELVEPSPLLDAALDRAEAAGAIVVAAAGNDAQDGPAWPASHPTVIAVGATDGAGHLWNEPMRGMASNAGADVFAPGREIVALSKTGTRRTGEGTSFATPQVSGVCALMLAVNPELTPAQVRQILKDTARNEGLIDAAAALEAAADRE